MAIDSVECCKAAIFPCPAPAELEPAWRSLAARAEGSVFLSWPWIGTLLTLFASSALLVRIEKESRLVGLALLGRDTRPGRLPMMKTSFCLNESGDPAVDRITIEYNDILAETASETDARGAFLELLAARGDWRSLRLAGVGPGWSEACAHASLAYRPLAPPQPAPWSDLSGLEDGDPLSALSRNSREQIRRSLRFFEESGALAIERAEDAGPALEWFAEMAALHTETWTKRGRQGAFQGPEFALFHRRLIEAHFAEQVPDMLRLRAGDRVLGYLYNLRWRGVVHTYQSGFLYGEDPRWRPGLAAHLLAMRLYAREGASAYRFLGGQARYKASLSNRTDELQWLTAYRPGAMSALEDGARALKRAVRALVTP